MFFYPINRNMFLRFVSLTINVSKFLIGKNNRFEIEEFFDIQTCLLNLTFEREKKKT